MKPRKIVTCAKSPELIKDRFWPYDANHNTFSLTYLLLRKVLQSFMGIFSCTDIVHSMSHPFLAPSGGHNFQYPKDTVKFPFYGLYCLKYSRCIRNDCCYYCDYYYCYQCRLPLGTVFIENHHFPLCRSHILRQ